MALQYKICSKCSEEKPTTEYSKHSKHYLRSYCKKCAYISAKDYNSKYPEKVAKCKNNWYKNNKEQVFKIHYDYVKKRKKSDPEFKLSLAIRARFKQAIKHSWLRGKTLSYLGCSISEYKKYLESKFQPGMTWENYGEWHIDHILPLCSFNLKDELEVSKACHFSNTQPLWALDNLKKSSRIVP